NPLRLRLIVLIEATQDLAYAPHFAADVLELAEHGIGRAAVLLEVRATRVGNAVELLGPFCCHARVAHLLEPGKRRVDHARAGAVKAPGALLKGFDELVAVTRPFCEEREQDKPQIAGGQSASPHEVLPHRSEPPAEMTVHGDHSNHRV